jgi:two-component system, NtrC family, nitrogen regulation sensor histidine kinase NtrY
MPSPRAAFTLARSLRARLMLVVLAVGVAPLALLGIWLSRATLRGGEALLRERLAATLALESTAIGTAWVPARSRLLDLASSPALLAALGEPRATAAADGAPFAGPPPVLSAAFERLEPAVEALTVRDRAGHTRWTLAREGDPGAPRFHVLASPLVVSLPIAERSGEALGTLAADLSLAALRAFAPPPATAGAILMIFDAASGEPLGHTPVDPELARRERFVWQGEEWVAVFAPVAEPALVLVAAAPLALFTAPFAEAARSGLALLVLVALGGLAAVALLAGRMTRSLERLAETAEAVAAGELERATGVTGVDEVGRVARAFDAMTASLRGTLAELAARRALAATGELAAALAHEVRNPLTSIKLDLQEVEETLPPGSALRQIQGGAIGELDRLDRIVGETLGIARSGRIEKQTVDLVTVVRAAARGARASFEERGATLDLPPPEAPPLPVAADPDALARALLNLLRNAAEALPPGGRAAVELAPEAGAAVVRVCDQGSGIAPELLTRIFEPFFSTRSGGTGLGLAVARRIVEAHGGEIGAMSELGRGTTMSVRLPAGAGTDRTGLPSKVGTQRSGEPP